MDGAVDNWVSVLARLQSEESLIKQRALVQRVVDEAVTAAEKSKLEVAKAQRLTKDSLQALDKQLRDQGHEEHDEVMRKVQDTHT